MRHEKMMIAAMALQGMLANPGTNLEMKSDDRTVLVNRASLLADELLDVLRKETPEINKKADLLEWVKRTKKQAEIHRKKSAEDADRESQAYEDGIIYAMTLLEKQAHIIFHE